MTKRRSRVNGEGSFYRRANGMWVGAATLPDGRRRYVTSRSQRAARERFRQLLREVEDNKPITSGRGVTVGRFLDQWVKTILAQRVAAGRMAASTLDSYRDNIALHIKPHIGDEELGKLTPARVRTWLVELQDKSSSRPRRVLREGETELPPPPKLSSRTMQYCHAILRRALGDAVRDEIVSRNVAALVEAPVVRREPIQPPTKEEAAKLLAAAAEDRLAALWLTLIAVGLRKSEAIRLRWPDIDLANETLTVREGKTAASKATLPLPSSVVETLREHRRRQAEERLAAHVWVDPEVVFASTVGTPLGPRNVTRAWEEVCRRAGVRHLRVHDLRHATATYLGAKQKDLKAIQGYMRHSRLGTTADVYMHVIEEVQRGSANAMDEVLAELRGAH